MAKVNIRIKARACQKNDTGVKFEKVEYNTLNLDEWRRQVVEIERVATLAKLSKAEVRSLWAMVVSVDRKLYKWFQQYAWAVGCLDGDTQRQVVDGFRDHFRNQKKI